MLNRIPRLETIIESRRVDSKYHDQIDPALGEKITGVPVDDATTSLDIILDSIQQLCHSSISLDLCLAFPQKLLGVSSMSHLILINDPAVILVTPSLMALLILHHLVDRKVTKTSPFR